MNKAKGQTKYENLFFSKTNEFLGTFLARQASKSGHTAKSYREGLSVFYEYVTVTKGISPLAFSFSDCTYQFVSGFSQYMQETLHYARSTVNSRLAAIRSYLGHVSDGDISLTSVYLAVCKVPTLSVQKAVRPIIAPADLPAFLDSPGHTRIGNRDRFILILLFDTAIRVGEIVAIRLGDITVDGQKCLLLIHGKGRKERCVTLSEKAAGHMRAYLEAYHKDRTDPSRPLLYTIIHDRIAPMSSRNIERILKKYGDAAREMRPSIPDRVYPHLVRRTRAITLYRDGVPIEQVSALLGHSQIETTRSHYASPSPEQMRKAVNKGSDKEPKSKPEWIGHEAELKKRFGL